MFSQPHPSNCHTNTVCVHVSGELENSDDDDDIIASISMHVHSTPEKMKNAIKSLSPSDALKEYRTTNIREDALRENFYVSRLEGSEELKRDILSLYKNQKKNLRAPMKVRFDGEEGVGSGTVREFFELVDINMFIPVFKERKKFIALWTLVTSMVSRPFINIT